MAKRQSKEDLMGLVFSRLTIIDMGPSINQERTVICKCICGNQKTVNLSLLKGGRVQSCGCLLQKSIDAMHTVSRNRPTDPDHTQQCPEYRTWINLKGRCLNPKNPKFADYGGRGITVCDRWMHDFDAFLSDMGRKPSPDHSLDRKDVDGNYEPDNCRWATPEEQMNNQRKTKRIEFNHRTQSLKQWCRELNLPYGTILARLKKGRSPQQALTDPVLPVGPGHGR